MADNDSIAADKILDAKGLTCPLPVLRARKVMVEVPAGGVLRVEATDPGSLKDIEAFCKAGGHRLMSKSVEYGAFIFIIKKAG